MRRLFVVLLLVLIAAASLAYLAHFDTGYVLVELYGFTVETTVWVAALAGLVLLLAFYYVARALLIVMDLIAGLAGARARRREGFLARWRARRRLPTRRGVLAFFEGRWRDALRQLARGARRAEVPLLNHLLAARASHELGDEELAEGFLQLAAEVPDAAHAVAVLRATVALDRDRPADALSVLDAAGLDPRTQPAGVALLLDALEREGDWERIRELLPGARRHGVQREARLDALEERAFCNLATQPDLSHETLRNAWNALTRALRQQPGLVAAHAGALVRVGRVDDAARELTHALEQGWDERLVRAYGLLSATDARRQLAFAESQLDAHAREPELLLALGRIALRNRLWGKARDYFDASLRLAPRPETCAELARLCESLGEHDNSRILLARAVHGAIGELPTLPMPGR